MPKNDTGALELQIANVIGELIEFWGFKAVMGRLWTILYLSDQPLAALELGERLSISAGSVSMALAELQKWGVVKKGWRPGERRDYYEPETSVWKMVARVYRERELIRIKEAMLSFESALSTLATFRRGASADERKRLRFIESRISTLLALSRLGENLLTMLVSGAAIDPGPLVKFFAKGDKE